MENKFEYTYSAPRNAEIEEIRKKYAPQILKLTEEMEKELND